MAENTEVFNPVFLNKVSGKISKKNIFSFDVESYGQKNTFLLVSLVGTYLNSKGNVAHVEKTFHSQDEFFEYLDSHKTIFHSKHRKGCYIFATNLGFDIGVLTKHTKYEGEIQLIMKGSNVMAAKYHGITFLDTMNFSPLSVEKQGEFLKIPKMAYPKYITEERKPEDEELPYIIEYNLQDCEITRQFAVFLQDSFNELGCNMKLTIASTAMDLFRRKYLKKAILKPTENIIEMLRKAYYGGRTEAFQRGKITNKYYYDFNSMYPSVMRNELPDPNYQRYYAKSSNQMIFHDGISLCEITSPKELLIPFLPYRTETKLLFPLGNWEGWYSHIELRKALELGYKIKVKSSIIYLKNGYFLKEYAEDLYKKRLDNKGNPMEFAIKILLNSLYGKFAERNTKDNIKHVNQLKNTDEYIEIPDSEYVNVIEKITPEKKKHINPIWSIYITAYARIKLYEEFEKIGFENVIYCDTDSIITGKEIEDSHELGKLKLEKIIHEGIIVRPKVYCIDGKCRVKGVNMKGLEFENILQCKEMRQRQFLKLKRSIKSHGKYEIGEIIYFNKLVNIEDEKRKWNEKFNDNILEKSIPIYLNI